LKKNLYFCRKCGAEEQKNTTGKGSMWIRAGRVIAAPEAVKESLERAKENHPSGEWDKHNGRSREETL
jgi:hypothetical protein